LNEVGRNDSLAGNKPQSTRDYVALIIVNKAGSYAKGQMAGDLAKPVFNFCQAERWPERKDAQRKTLPLNLRAADDG